MRNFTIRTHRRTPLGRSDDVVGIRNKPGEIRNATRFGWKEVLKERDQLVKLEEDNVV